MPDQMTDADISLLKRRVDKRPMGLLHLFRKPALDSSQRSDLMQRINQAAGGKVVDLESEFCFNIESSGPISTKSMKVLEWLLSETFEPEYFSRDSFLTVEDGILFEVGPRMNFSTAWSTNAVSICHACGLPSIERIERSRRYLFKVSDQITDIERIGILDTIHDRMTECLYPAPLETFDTGILPEPVYHVPLLEDGRSALEKINREM
ncbi:MAG: hypothetical protein HXS50_01120, partial [Theionarchaea archaeon]|nr:hypothetical protein [Theionarchaea archaeon]